MNAITEGAELEELRPCNVQEVPAPPVAGNRHPKRLLTPRIVLCLMIAVIIVEAARAYIGKHIGPLPNNKNPLLSFIPTDIFNNSDMVSPST